MDRFFTIRFPLKYGRNKTKKYMLLKIVLVWLISILICFPMFTLGVYNPKNVFNAALKECTLEHKEFKIYGSIFAFYIPLLIIGVTYIFTMKSLNSLMNAKIKYDFLNGTSMNSNNVLASSGPTTPVTSPKLTTMKLHTRKIFEFFKSKNNTNKTNKFTFHNGPKLSLVNYSHDGSISVATDRSTIFRRHNDSLKTTTTRIDDYHEITSQTNENRKLEKIVCSNLLHPKSIPYHQRRACSFNESYLMRRNNAVNLDNTNTNVNLKIIDANKSFHTVTDYNNSNNNNPLITQKYILQKKLPLISRYSFLIRKKDSVDSYNSNNMELQKILQKYFSETNLILKLNKKNVNALKNDLNRKSSRYRTKKFKINNIKSKSDFYLYFKKYSKLNPNYSSLYNLNIININSKKSKAVCLNSDQFKYRFSLKLKNSQFKRTNKDKIEEYKKLQKILASIEREMDAFLLITNKDLNNARHILQKPRKLSVRQKIPNNYNINSSTNTSSKSITTTRTIIGSFKRSNHYSYSVHKNEKNKFSKLFDNFIKKDEKDEKEIYESNPILTKPKKKYDNGFLYPEESRFFGESVFSNTTYMTEVPYLSHHNSINSINVIANNEADAIHLKNFMLNRMKKNSAVLITSNFTNTLSSVSANNTNSRCMKLNLQNFDSPSTQNRSEHRNNSIRKSITNKEANIINQTQLSGFSKANNERKAVKVLIIIFVIFVALWTPFFVVNTLSVFCPDSCKPIFSFMGLFTWLGYISSSVNPIIYTVFNKSFRQTFIALLRCRTEFFDLRHHQRLFYERKNDNRKIGLTEMNEKSNNV